MKRVERCADEPGIQQKPQTRNPGRQSCARTRLPRTAAEVTSGTGSELHVVYVDPLPGFMKNGRGTLDYGRALYEQIEQEFRQKLCGN